MTDYHSHLRRLTESRADDMHLDPMAHFQTLAGIRPVLPSLTEAGWGPKPEKPVGPDWKAAAKKLLAKRTGKTSLDLHYRAYMRAIMKGHSVVATHLVKEFDGAREARKDLIDLAGKNESVDAGGLEEGEESVFDKPQWVKDFKAGWEASKKAKKEIPPKKAYNMARVSKKHGTYWVDGYAAWVDHQRGANAQPSVRDAKKMGLIEGDLDEALGVPNLDKWKSKAEGGGRVYRIHLHGKTVDVTHFGSSYKVYVGGKRHADKGEYKKVSDVMRVVSQAVMESTDDLDEAKSKLTGWRKTGICPKCGKRAISKGECKKCGWKPAKGEGTEPRSADDLDEAKLYTARTRADHEFALGWMDGMAAAADGKRGRTSGKSAEYGKGLKAGLAHWEGDTGSEKAHKLGLVKAYDGFHGQGGWIRPENSARTVREGAGDLDEAVSRKDADRYFKTLEYALKHNVLPADEGGHKHRKASADEFMFMSIIDHEGWEAAKFKHRKSRNYLIVRTDGKLIVPKGGAFHKGAFPEHVELDEAKKERALSPKEIPSAKSHLKSRRGIKMVGGKFKVGQKVKYGGKSYLFYDVQADRKAPQGVSIVLIRPDLKAMVAYVHVTDLSEDTDDLDERQKTSPGLGDEPQPGKPTKPVMTRQGSFKLSQKSLDLFKKMDGFTPDQALFKGQAKIMNAIPREKLPTVIGADSLPDAQDELARNPKGAIQKFMRNIHKVSPKAGKMLRAVPENAALYFYIYAMNLSGRDMADEILKRHLTTSQAFKPVKKEGADPVADGNVLITEDVRRFRVLAGMDPLPSRLNG